MAPASAPWRTKARNRLLLRLFAAGSKLPELGGRGERLTAVGLFDDVDQVLIDLGPRGGQLPAGAYADGPARRATPG